MESLTKEEMEKAVFFFRDSNQLRLVHLDPKAPKLHKTEKFFDDEGSIKKFKKGFGFVNVYLQGELRHLVLGLNQKNTNIWEFDREENDERLIY